MAPDALLELVLAELILAVVGIAYCVLAWLVACVDEATVLLRGVGTDVGIGSTCVVTGRRVRVVRWRLPLVVVVVVVVVLVRLLEDGGPLA